MRGCTKVSPGCKHCYAETFSERFRGVPGHPFEQGFDLRLVPEKLAAPLRWRKPRRIFVNSMSDLFHEGVSVEDQKHGLPRIDDLRAAPAAVRFLSVEPLLGDLGQVNLEGIHWVIAVGSELEARWS